MPIPDFVVALRERIGTMSLWLPGVTAVVLRDTEVLLVRRADNGQWTPVTGIIDPGEEPAVAAVREVLEEACVVATAERLVWVSAGKTILHANGDRGQYLDHTFRCSWVSGEPAVGDDESVDARWFPLDDLPEMTPRNSQRIAYAVENRPEAHFAR
ncbi:MAG: NUDIX domain-containing protein [Actinomycetota bacterium]|nr:NUDIX domain-containing protein [Actinomycetota bacterium]